MADIVQRSYQYVAMYNVNNKFAIQQGAWNIIVPDIRLKDHTMTDIARPTTRPCTSPRCWTCETTPL